MDEKVLLEMIKTQDRLAETVAGIQTRITLEKQMRLAQEREIGKLKVALAEKQGVFVGYDAILLTGLAAVFVIVGMLEAIL